MVEDGKLKATEAAELISALRGSTTTASAHTAVEEPAGAKAEQAEAHSPSEEKESEGHEESDASSARGHEDSLKDPFKLFGEFLDKLSKETSDKVNWQELGKQIREQTKRGYDQFVQGVEGFTKEGLGIFGNVEVKEVTLPLSGIAGKQLRISNPDGAIIVRGKSATSQIIGKAKVRANTPEEAKTRAQNFEIFIEESEHSVLIRQSEVVGIQVDYTIELAEDCTLELKSESAKIDVEGVTGGVSVNSRKGDIRLKDVNGVIDLTGQRGNASLENISGPRVWIEVSSGTIRAAKVSTEELSARTAEGDITVTDFAGRLLSADAVSGNLAIDISRPVDGPINLRSMSGNITIGISDGSDCSVKLSTIKGLSTSSIELNDAHNSESFVSGKLKDGKGTLDVSSVNGNITLSLRNSATN